MIRKLKHNKSEKQTKSEKASRGKVPEVYGGKDL